MEEKEKKEENKKSEDSVKEQEPAAIIWGQERVPNIKKGSNPKYPYYMMTFVVIIIILSFLFARLTH